MTTVLRDHNWQYFVPECPLLHPSSHACNVTTDSRAEHPAASHSRPICASAMSSGRHEVVNEYRIPSNYPEHAAIVQIHGPPGIKRGAQVKPAVRPNSLAAEVADDIRHAFVQYDGDHSGYIELRELERVSAALTLARSPRPLTQTLTQTRTTLRRTVRMLTRTRSLPCLMPCI